MKERGEGEEGRVKSVGQTQTMDSVLHTPPFIQGHAGREGRGREGEGGKEREMKGLALIKLMLHFSANKQCNVSKPDTIGTE